jgi:hypothetical protein
MISVSSLMTGDALLSYPLGGDTEDITDKLNMVTEDEVELIVFRAPKLSYSRMVMLHIDGPESLAIPLIHQRFDNGAQPALLKDARQGQSEAPLKSYAVRLSFWGLALIIITLVLVVIVIVLFVVLMVGTCRSPPAGAMRHGLQSNAAANEWGGDAELFYDNAPPVELLNDGSLFQHVANY